MLSVIVNWIYVIITTYILGFAALKWIVEIPHMYTAKGNKKSVYRIKRPESPLIAGIIVATVYAQLFSLIGGVGLLSNAVLVGVCVIILICNRYEIAETIFDFYRRYRKTAKLIIGLAVFLLFAYGTSHGLMHYDTDLYHAQSIRWIEEYGAVRGLGNLHLRLGYNSSAFALSALYSFHFAGATMHSMAGYFALLLAWQCIGIVDIVRRKHFVLSDFVRVIAIYYLFTIYDEMVSPASDYFMTTMVLYTVIVWLELYVEHERSFLPHALLSLCALYTVTVKLSAAPLVLLSVYPIYRLITKRKREAVKPILYFVLFGLLIVFPYISRNFILTGWLVYPVTGLNIFNTSWKVPLEKAVSDAHEIIAYGRGYTDPSGYFAPISQWMPLWISNLGTFNKFMFVLDIICLPVFLGCVAYYIIVKVLNKQRNEGKNDTTGKIFHISHRKSVNLADFLFLEAVIYASLFYWLFSSPLIRYGCIYLWLPPTILIGRFVILLYNRLELSKNDWCCRAVAGVLILFVAYKTMMLIVDDVPRFRPEYLVVQQEYNQYDLNEKTIDGISFYYPVEGDRTGYDPFPSAPSLEGFELLGNKLTDGFKSS